MLAVGFTELLIFLVCLVPFVLVCVLLVALIRYFNKRGKN